MKLVEVDVEDVQFIAEQLLGESLEAKPVAASRFLVDGATVLDTSAGLTWQREVPNQRFTWAKAKEYAAGLELAGGGWRLPTKEELASIVDYTRSNPAIDPVAFPNTPSEWFWSSSPYASYSNLAWLIYFGAGYTSYYYISYPYGVRCVR